MRSHVTAFRPISEAARSWSDDNVIINPVPAEYCESQEQLNCRIRNETINLTAVFVMKLSTMQHLVTVLCHSFSALHWQTLMHSITTTTT